MLHHLMQDSCGLGFRSSTLVARRQQTACTCHLSLSLSRSSPQHRACTTRFATLSLSLTLTLSLSLLLRLLPLRRHTNYLAYVREGQATGFLNAAALYRVNRWVVRIHCAKAIKLSDAVQNLPHQVRAAACGAVF